MARTISVKIPTSQLIVSIEEKIAEIDKAIAEYPAKREAYEKDMEAYKSKVAQFVSDYLSKNVKKIGYDYDSIIRISESYRNRVELTFDPASIADFPKKPEAPESPNQNQSFGREYTTRKNLLEKNLRILKMTSQEEVSASTYGALMEVL